VIMGTTAILASRILTPLIEIRDGVILAEGSKITAVGSRDHVPVPEGAATIDESQRIVVPGFIDLHHHGAMGHHNGESVEGTRKIAGFLAQTGTTGWLPTVRTFDSIRTIVELTKAGTDAAEILGIHMEGPYQAPKKVEGFEKLDSDIHRPSVEEYHEFLEAAQGHLKIITVAPEVEGGLELIGEVRRTGVIPAIGHSFATYEQFIQAVELGASHVTHVFQVMGLMHMRRPGVVGGALTCDQVTGELIADGVHNHPAVMEVLLRCKGPDKTAIITDMTHLAGMPDGEYASRKGLKVVKKGMVSRVAGSTEAQDYTIAGSVCTMDHNLRFLVESMNVPLATAVRMASLTPARIIGLDNRKGSIEVGKDADLAVIDEHVNVYLTMVGGEVVYQAA
jgi:N-acetylglucosamine-6-phosphate deacetylase